MFAILGLQCLPLIPDLVSIQQTAAISGCGGACALLCTHNFYHIASEVRAVASGLDPIRPGGSRASVASDNKGVWGTNI